MDIKKQVEKNNSIHFNGAVTCGFTRDIFGNGQMDISLHSPKSKYPWKDLCEINFNDPEASRRFDLGPDSPDEEMRGAYHTQQRRVSKIQAQYIALLIKNLLDSEFGGRIPSDEEIIEMAKERFPLDHFQ